MLQVWSGLEAFPDAAAAGLPCLGCPSDHLPVAATFTVCVCFTRAHKKMNCTRTHATERERASKRKSTNAALSLLPLFSRSLVVCALSSFPFLADFLTSIECFLFFLYFLSFASSHCPL